MGTYQVSPTDLLFSLLFGIMGLCVVYNYDLLCALSDCVCVYIDNDHAALQAKLAIRGQLQKVTLPPKLL